jgi:hypothetical protein
VTERSGQSSGGRVPTEKQHRALLTLADGGAGVAWGKRDTAALIRREWVTAKLDGNYYMWVRITPKGLRALAESVERYGLPDLAPKPKTGRRVCADCGSAHYRLEVLDVPDSAAELRLRAERRVA